MGFYPARVGEMVKSHRDFNAFILKLLNEGAIAFDGSFIELSLGRLHARPLHRHPIERRTRLLNQLNIVKHTLPMVRSCAGFLMIENVPRVFPVFPVGVVVVAFDLVARRGGAPFKMFGKFKCYGFASDGRGFSDVLVVATCAQNEGAAEECRLAQSCHRFSLSEDLRGQ